MCLTRRLRIGSPATAVLLALSFTTVANAGVVAPPRTGNSVQLVHMDREHDRSEARRPCPYMEGGYQGYMMRQRRAPEGMEMYRGGRSDMMRRRGMMEDEERGAYMMGREGRGPRMMDRSDMAPGMRVVPYVHLSVADVRHFLEHQVELGGNKRLKVGEVKELDAGRILADIVTQEGALVDRFEVDRHTGEMNRAE